MNKENLDRLLNKWISRKLSVFIAACVGLFSGYLTSSDWVVIATAYIGIQGFTDIVNKLRL
jgi:ABC-type Co2+ transport system permease subunit